MFLCTFFVDFNISRNNIFYKFELTILVDLVYDFLQALFCDLKTHHSENGGDGLDADASGLFCVEGVESLAEACKKNIIVS